jgi:hypothetical protein
MAWPAIPSCSYKMATAVANLTALGQPQLAGCVASDICGCQARGHLSAGSHLAVWVGGLLSLWPLSLSTSLSNGCGRISVMARKSRISGVALSLE